MLSAGDDTEAGGGWIDDVAEVFAPPYLFRGSRPTVASAPCSIGYGGQFTIGAGGGASRAVLMAPGATTHANDMNQRHVELAVSPTAGGLLAAGPPSPNVAPPGPYMLFVLNPEGVPSAARWVWVGVPVPPGYAGCPGAGGGPAGGPGTSGAGHVAPPRVKRLRVGVVFTRGAPTIRLVLKTDVTFRGTLGLYPTRKGRGGRALRRALVSKRIAGPGGRNVVLPARFARRCPAAVRVRDSTKGKSFRLKLGLAMRLQDRSGGAIRVVSRTILVRRAPPSARFLR